MTDPIDRRDLAAAVQAAISRQLADRSERAMEIYRDAHEEDERRFVVAGGVAANAAVRAALEAVAGQQGFGFTAPPLVYCTDNAAMIALAGAERLAEGLVDGLDAPPGRAGRSTPPRPLRAPCTVPAERGPRRERLSHRRGDRRRRLGHGPWPRSVSGRG